MTTAIVFGAMLFGMAVTIELMKANADKFEKWIDSKVKS